MDWICVKLLKWMEKKGWKQKNNGGMEGKERWKKGDGEKKMMKKKR